MTEPDLPYVKPAQEIPPETNELIPPSPDVKNPLPNHEPVENVEIEVFICPVCGKSFTNKTDLDLHMSRNHGQLKKA